MPHRTNRLLESLSAETQQAILSVSRAVDLPAGQVLVSPGDMPPYVYFLSSGLASIAITVPDGGCAEVGVVGREGLAGVRSLLGSHKPVARCFMQIGGAGLRVPLAEAQRIFTDNAEFRSRVLQYLQAEVYCTTQLAACNKLHQAEERLARWLLTAADRTANDIMPLTQEGLSQMLGTRRTTVALVAGEMQRKGLLRYRRGLVKIADRDALTSTACDCYRITHGLLHNLYA